MIIEHVKRAKQTMRFKDLKPGDVFVFENFKDYPYIKSARPDMAFGFKDNMEKNFSPVTHVILFNSTLTVEER